MVFGPYTVVYLLVFASAFMVMQLVVGAGRQGAKKIKTANIRMQIMARKEKRSDALGGLLKSRGLDETGQFKKIFKWFNVMIVQSGMRIGAHGFYIIMSISAFVVAVGVYLYTSDLYYFGAGFIGGFIFPILVLRFFVKRRGNKAIRQLPEALDIVVRSLRAGHPVPVAIDLVAREMPDPLGSEFGIASDEITYGSGLGKAMQRLANRIPHDDFDMFAATIRLQEKTGGDLAELLSKSSKMIRDRLKMRLKIKAASAEGRMSAIILNIIPLFLFAAINFLTPDFYGDVKDSPIVATFLKGIVVWMIIGNLVIRKMINFKI